jgi:hypothetical protein
VKYSSHKEIDKLVRELVRKGWIFWRGGKHGRLRAPSGKDTLTVPVSPSCKNVLKNFAGDVKRAGRD